MKISGEATLVAPLEKVWDALLDPSVLVATIPGCQQLETTAENTYAMTVTAGVAAVRGTYSGTCALTDLKPRQSLVLSAQGSGAPGTIGAEVAVTFDDNGDGTTTLTYQADATIGGTLGGVGQRMLSSVSRRLATEFFTNVERVIAQGVPGVAPELPTAERAPAAGPVYTAPERPGGDRDEFVKGLLTGAALVLAGVVAGALVNRRR